MTSPMLVHELVTAESSLTMCAKRRIGLLVTVQPERVTCQECKR